jgi:hypothetical protein
VSLLLVVAPTACSARGKGKILGLQSCRAAPNSRFAIAGRFLITFCCWLADFRFAFVVGLGCCASSNLRLSALNFALIAAPRLAQWLLGFADDWGSHGRYKDIRDWMILTYRGSPKVVRFYRVSWPCSLGRWGVGVAFGRPSTFTSVLGCWAPLLTLPMYFLSFQYLTFTACRVSIAADVNAVLR